MILAFIYVTIQKFWKFKEMKTVEIDYDYVDIEQRLISMLPKLEGLKVISIQAQIVAPEFNQIFLTTNDVEFRIYPKIGGEVITVSDDGFSLDKDEMVFVDIAKQFWGLTIAQARSIGSAWNAHGVEISFIGNPIETLIVTSVECKENNTEVHDALRFSVCRYTYEIEDSIQ